MRTVIVDYGLGNLFSVARAVQAAGGTAVISDDPEAVAAADRLILPGVGAFGDGMKGLAERGLIEPVQRAAREGRPVLGICLGMQLLLDVGEEFGRFRGLELIPGRVSRLAPVGDDGAVLKLPHIGWSPLVSSAPWSGTLLEGLPPEASMYFVHSFAPAAADRADVLAECRYGSTVFTAVVRKGSVTGCQFHPEKSGPLGLGLLRRFLS